MTPEDEYFPRYTQDTQNKLRPCGCSRDYKNHKCANLTNLTNSNESCYLCANLASESCYLSKFFTRVTEWDNPTEGHSSPMVCVKEKTTISASMYLSPELSGVRVKLRKTKINVGMRKMIVCQKLSEEEQSKCCNEKKYVCNVWRTTAAYMDPVLFPAIFSEVNCDLYDRNANGNANQVCREEFLNKPFKDLSERMQAYVDISVEAATINF